MLLCPCFSLRFMCVFVAVAIGSHGCSQKADIPRDVSCNANTYRLFTRRAIFEAIRQSDIRKSFAATSQESHSPCLPRKKGCFLHCDGSLSLPREIDLDTRRTRIVTHKSSIFSGRIYSLFLYCCSILRFFLEYVFEIYFPAMISAFYMFHEELLGSLELRHFSCGNAGSFLHYSFILFLFLWKLNN